MDTERDTSNDVTVPHMVGGTLPMWAGEERAQAGQRKGRRKKSPQERKYHVVHQPSGYPLVSVMGEDVAEQLCRLLSSRASDYGTCCSLGDPPNEGEGQMVGCMAQAVAEDWDGIDELPGKTVAA